MISVDRIMRSGVRDKVFPGAQLAVSRKGKILFHGAYGVSDLFSCERIMADTIFDLASFTKPLATTLAIMKLVQEGEFETGEPAGMFLPELNACGKGRITIRELLLHTSGLPPHRPFYERLIKIPPDLRKGQLLRMICNEPLLCDGVASEYSDLGFMLLGMIVERVSGCRMDHFLYEKIYGPMGLDNLFFVDLGSKSCPILSKMRFASTESCPWRNRVLRGEVHDDNAHAAGGVAGHAGLFGTALDVNYLLDDLLNTFHGSGASGVFFRETVRLFFQKDDFACRTLGFDVPSGEKSSSGSFFSEKSVGHLGFTGTSFWVDLPRSVIVVLLTNRVHPSRDNEKIRSFRPALHDMVMDEILSGPG